MHPASHSVSSSPSFASRVAAIRRFNRFYTRQIGVLGQSLLNSPFSLAEVRILYELAHREDVVASTITRDLDMDAGYMSRILRDFIRRGFVQKKRSASDRRQHLLALTPRGRKAFASLDRRASQEVSNMLRPLSGSSQNRLVSAMNKIEDTLRASSRPSPKAPSYILRPHCPGDMGWIVHRHGTLYSQEYGYDEQFEALVACIVGEFIQNLDVKRERCWIAERSGEIVGSVFLVKKSISIAKLRLLYVEPSARGLGIGRRLVEECIQFARKSGYKTMTLWTQSHLDAARHIYKKAGFRCVRRTPHHSFSLDLVAETWDLAL